MQPLNQVIGKWMSEAEDEMQVRFQIQCIYPTEVYKGWLAENARRAAAKGGLGWYSTGEGVKSVTTKVVDASAPSKVTVAISHLEHMMFADMGVGQGRDYEDVQHKRKAHHNRRYIGKWEVDVGKTHRPVIMYKARQLQKRMENYIADFYGQAYEVRFIQATTAMDKPFEIFGF